jgi:hypothetical protein
MIRIGCYMWERLGRFGKYRIIKFHRIDRPDSLVLGHTRLCEVDALLNSLGYRFVTIYTQGVPCNEPIGTYNALYMGRWVNLSSLESPDAGPFPSTQVLATSVSCPIAWVTFST